MFAAIFWLFIGLMVGWFFLPMPGWAKTLGEMIIAKVPYLARFVKK